MYQFSQVKWRKTICQMTDFILLQIVNKIVIRQESLCDKRNFIFKECLKYRMWISYCFTRCFQISDRKWIGQDKWPFYDHFWPFFASMILFQKTEVETVILRCLTSLNLIWFKSYDTKCKCFHIQTWQKNGQKWSWTAIFLVRFISDQRLKYGKN